MRKLLLCVALASGVPAASFGQTNWTRSQLAVDYSLTSVIHDGRRFMATASVGSFLTSTDGRQWSLSADRVPGALGITSVAYGNGTYVAVGLLGIALRSSDGATWTPTRSGTESHLFSVAYNEVGGFVAVGSGGKILQSRDGTTWESRTSSATVDLRSIAASAGRYVAVGDTYNIINSTDGVTWARSIFNDSIGGLGGVAFGAPYIVAVGSLNGFRPARSETGVVGSWTRQLADVGFYETAITYGANRYVAAGIDGIGVSVDGFSWVNRLSLGVNPANRPRAVAFGNNTFVMVGDRALVYWSPASDDPLPVRPVITALTTARTVPGGATIALSVEANGGPLTYQWRRDGSSIAGGTSKLLIWNPGSTLRADYSVVVTNAAGSTTSAAIPISTTIGTNAGRLINLSIRTNMSDGNPLILGTVIGGSQTSGNKPILMRAAGPSLSAFGITTFMPDPQLELFAGTTRLLGNDNWGGVAQTAAAMASVGAFTLSSPASLDAVIFNPSMAPRDYTLQVSGVSGSRGEVIAEIYDATATPDQRLTTPRLINVSVRKLVQPGSSMIAGFVIGGVTARTVMIRAIGPALVPFGVSDAAADPKVSLYSGSTEIMANDDWGGDAQITTVGGRVGAFTLSSPTSKDAVILATLAPGSYTAQVAAAAAGTVLVEIYEVP